MVVKLKNLNKKLKWLKLSMSISKPLTKHFVESKIYFYNFMFWSGILIALGHTSVELAHPIALRITTSDILMILCLQECSNCIEKFSSSKELKNHDCVGRTRKKKQVCNKYEIMFLNNEFNRILKETLE